MSTQAVPFVTPEEYLAAERAADFKSEYVSGQIWAMSGASREHNAIATNLIVGLHAVLRGGPCEVFGSDMRVFVPENVTFAYPDVSVVCGEQQYTDAAVDTLLNPTILIEILSPPTAHYDRNIKFLKYRRLPSLREYLLVHQDNPRVERFEKFDDIWASGESAGLNSTLHLSSVGVTVPLADIYDRVSLPTSDETPP